MNNITERHLPTPTFLYRNYLYKKQLDKISTPKYFLDIGPANGFLLKELSLRGFSGEAIDISKEAVKQINKNLKLNRNINVYCGDFMKSKIKNKYDLIFCFEVLEHIKNDKDALNQIARLIKPGGKVMLSFPAHKKYWSKIDEQKGHFRRYERKEAWDKISNSGFEIEEVYTYGFPFLFFLRFLRNRIIQHGAKNTLSKINRTKISGLTNEYDSRLEKLFTSKYLLTPFFLIMDLFIKTDKGLGYFIVARKT